MIKGNVESTAGTAEVIEQVRNELKRRGLLGLAEEVAARRYVELAEMLGPCRDRIAVGARQELWYLIYERTPSLHWIARLFGRNHSTIRMGIRRHMSGRSCMQLRMLLRTAGPAPNSCIDEEDIRTRQ